MDILRLYLFRIFLFHISSVIIFDKFENIFGNLCIVDEIRDLQALGGIHMKLISRNYISFQSVAYILTILI